MKKIHLDSIPDFNESEEFDYIRRKSSYLAKDYSLRMDKPDDELAGEYRTRFLSIMDFVKFYSKVLAPEFNAHRLQIKFNIDIRTVDFFLVKGDDKINLKSCLDQDLPIVLKRQLNFLEDNMRSYEACKHAMSNDLQFHLKSGNKDTNNNTLWSQLIFLDSNSALENPFYKNLSFGIQSDTHDLDIQNLTLKTFIRDDWAYLTQSILHEDYDTFSQQSNLKDYMEDFEKEDLDLFKFVTEKAHLIKDPKWIESVLNNLNKDSISFDLFMDSYLNGCLYMNEHEDLVFNSLKNKGFEIPEKTFLDFLSKGHPLKIKQTIKLLKELNPKDNEKPLLFEVLEKQKVQTAILLIQQGANPFVHYDGKDIKSFFPSEKDDLISMAEIEAFKALEKAIENVKHGNVKKTKLKMN
jgi:hypothetical protein